MYQTRRNVFENRVENKTDSLRSIASRYLELWSNISSQSELKRGKNVGKYRGIRDIQATSRKRISFRRNQLENEVY